MLRFSARGSLCRGDRCNPPPVRGWRAATRPPHHPRHQEIPAAACQPPAGHRIRSTECIDRGWLRVACCKVLMSVVGVKLRHSSMQSACLKGATSRREHLQQRPPPPTAKENPTCRSEGGRWLIHSHLTGISNSSACVGLSTTCRG